MNFSLFGTMFSQFLHFLIHITLIVTAVVGVIVVLLYLLARDFYEDRFVPAVIAIHDELFYCNRH